MTVIQVFLGLGAAFGFVVLWSQDFWNAYKEEGTVLAFAKSAKMRETLYFLAIMVVPFVAVNVLQDGKPLFPFAEWLMPWISGLLSLGISWFWYSYVASLDIFEREPIRTVILTFVLACMAIWLVFPMTQWLHQYGFQLNGDPWNDWWYCVFGIGLVEEVVKILPFMIVLRFTKDVNEPFDYILYGSVSALGFAFVENISYLNDWNLTSILGRSLYSSLAHMFFTCLITYTLALAHYRYPKWKWSVFPAMLLVAALAHGFYDFWLINEAMQMPWITSIFFLLSMQVWMTMKNNLINISPYYTNEGMILEKNMRYRLVNGLITLIYLAYVVIFLTYGRINANDYLLSSWTTNIYVLIFVAINFGSHEIIPGRINPLIYSTRPLTMLLPRFFAVPTKTGTRLTMTRLISSRRGIGLASLAFTKRIPLAGQLGRRVIFNQDTDCYMFVLDHPMELDGELLSTRLLIANADDNYDLDDRKLHPLKVYAVHRDLHKFNGMVREADVFLIGMVLARRD